MKKIWDTQSNKTYYAIDEEAMHRRVMKKNTRIKRMTNFDEWGIIIIALMVAGFMAYRGIAHNQNYKFATSAIFLTVAIYMFWNRKKRIQNDGFSDNTVLGDLEQAIRTIDYYIDRARKFIWWFIMPAVLSMIINLSYTYEGEPLVIPGLIGTILLGLFVVHLSLKYSVLPKKRELESLRKTLTDSE